MTRGRRASAESQHGQLWATNRDLSRKQGMDRLECFERMLADLIKQADHEQAEMDRLRSAGKEKTATYRQYFTNRMLYKTMLEKYKQYGLLD